MPSLFGVGDVSSAARARSREDGPNADRWSGSTNVPVVENTLVAVLPAVEGGPSVVAACAVPRAAALRLAIPVTASASTGSAGVAWPNGWRLDFFGAACLVCAARRVGAVCL